jgi:hypothetical protein
MYEIQATWLHLFVITNNTVKAYKSALSLQGIFPQALSEQDIFLQTLF